jgi:hypothetical protein
MSYWKNRIGIIKTVTSHGKSDLAIGIAEVAYEKKTTHTVHRYPKIKIVFI